MRNRSPSDVRPLVCQKATLPGRVVAVPARLPSARMTRWQGTTIGIGFAAMTFPTARAARGNRHPGELAVGNGDSRRDRQQGQAHRALELSRIRPSRATSSNSQAKRSPRKYASRSATQRSTAARSALEIDRHCASPSGRDATPGSLTVLGSHRSPSPLPSPTRYGTGPSPWLPPRS